MTRKKVLLPLAAGFEEIEAATIIDVLRRAEIEVVTASLAGKAVTGSHGITFLADTELLPLEAGPFDAVVLPGGMPGAKHLREDPRVLTLLCDAAKQGKIVAAICAAPTVLEAAGLLSGRSATSYPGHPLPSARYSEERVVEDENLVTSRAAGTAFEFSLRLVERLVGKAVSEKLRSAMLVD